TTAATETLSATPATATPTPTITLTPTITPTPTITGTPLPTLVKDSMGIQAYGNLNRSDWRHMLDLAQNMGVGWIKVQLSWKELETAKGQFAQQYGVLITNFFDAGKRGFKILISVAKAPDWARPDSARGKNDGPPANPKDLSDFILHMM